MAQLRLQYPTPPESILETIEKLKFLQELGVDQWDLSSLNPNRQKFLAQVGRKSTNQALQRIAPQRRYPILLTFLYQSLQDITDELIDLFDRCLPDRYKNAKRDNQAFRVAIAKTTNEKRTTQTVKAASESLIYLNSG